MMLRSQPYCPPPDDGLELVYQDNALLAINKPAGLLSVPGRGAALQDCALLRVQQRFPSALLVHRLDEATSGLLVFALHPWVQKQLGLAFETRTIVKSYVALIHGIPSQSLGVIDAPIAKDWQRRPLHVVDEYCGKPAQTYFELLSNNDQKTQSRCSLQPKTGRTHQLRVHLQHIGHPIVGDRLYGLAQDTAPRLMLHACGLELAHPAQADTKLEITSCAPF